MTACFGVAAVAGALASLRAIPLALCALTAIAAALVVDVVASEPGEVLVPSPSAGTLLLGYGASLIAAAAWWFGATRERRFRRGP